MPEDGGTDRPGDKAHRVNQECLKGSDYWIRLGEEQFGEEKAGRGRIEEEVVPLDRCADGAGDDRSPQLGALVDRRRVCCHK
jgi:hypothetical protein